MGLLNVLMRPDSEESEHAERMVIVTAANLLQVGEFQFLQLAYREWYNRDMPDASVSRLFTRYMMHDEVPAWARHYARLIMTRAESGCLNADDPTYHRYDNDYHTEAPHGVRRFLTAVFILTGIMTAAIAIVMTSSADPVSQLPPYVDRDDAPKAR